MPRTDLLHSLLTQRILVLDGAMGTMIQSYKLGEADYRGERFAEFAASLDRPIEQRTTSYGRVAAGMAGSQPA